MSTLEEKIQQLEAEIRPLEDYLKQTKKLYEEDGTISDEEQAELDEIVQTLEQVKERIQELKEKKAKEDRNKAPCGGGTRFTKPMYDCKVGVSYEISVLVDQPGDGGDRDPYEGGLLSDVDVGHTFVHLLKKNKDGSTAEITVGFYPSKEVDPMKPEVKGMLIHDKGHAAEVKATKKVTHDQFFKAVKYIEDQGSATYNLNTYNCTDFGICVAGAAGWNISSQRGKWPFGGGHNPGDLGEDLKDDHNGQIIPN